MSGELADADRYCGQTHTALKQQIESVVASCRIEWNCVRHSKALAWLVPNITVTAGCIRASQLRLTIAAPSRVVLVFAVVFIIRVVRIPAQDVNYLALLRPPNLSAACCTQGTTTRMSIRHFPTRCAR